MDSADFVLRMARLTAYLTAKHRSGPRGLPGSASGPFASEPPSGVLLRIRGLWRWVALVIFVVFMVFFPDGFIGG